ncbi:MAG: hypothetical protein N3A54_04050 [Patescibacteria group bacterium]|nr:hypothetical protein [Patescibacteria group bacterium]
MTALLETITPTFDPTRSLIKNSYPVCMSPLMVWNLKGVPFTYIAKLKSHNDSIIIHQEIKSEKDALSLSSYIEMIQPDTSENIYRFFFPLQAEIVTTSSEREPIVLGEIQRFKNSDIYKLLIDCGKTTIQAARKTEQQGFSPIVPNRVRFFGY